MTLGGFSAHEIAGKVRRGEVTAEAVTRAALDRIESSNPMLNCFTTVLRGKAVEDARALDARIAHDGPVLHLPRPLIPTMRASDARADGAVQAVGHAGRAGGQALVAGGIGWSRVVAGSGRPGSSAAVSSGAPQARS